MSTKQNQQNKLFSNLIFDYEEELRDIWLQKIKTKISGGLDVVMTLYFLDSNKRKKRLNPDAQRLILELATVNRIQVTYANAFNLRSLRLQLIIEEQGGGI